MSHESQTRRLRAAFLVVLYVGIDVYIISEIPTPQALPVSIFLAAGFGASFVSFAHGAVWGVVVTVAMLTLLLPFLILIAVGLPVYHSLPFLLSRMLEFYGTEWQRRGLALGVEAFGPVATAACTAFAVGKLRGWRTSNRGAC